MLSALRVDLGAALGSLRASRATAAAAVLTLAIGTGAAVAVTAVAYGALYRPIPARAADQLVSIDIGGANGGALTQGVPAAEVAEWRDRARLVSGVAGWSASEFTVRGAGAPEAVQVAVVTEDFFDLMGVRGAAGRPFGAADPGTVAVASASYASRLRRLGLDPLGQSITVGVPTLQVAAVVPETFALPDGVDLWVPASAVEQVAFGSTADIRSFQLLARLAPGVTVERAAADLARVLREIDDARGRPADRRVVLSPIRDRMIGSAGPALAAFVAAGAMLLVVACANVATLLVSRAVRRQREFAVRLAVGASPSRLVRVALAESLLVAGAGAAAGLGLAWLVLSVVVPYTAGGLPEVASAGLGVPLFVVTGAVALAATVLSGVAPAMTAARADFAHAFRAATVAGPAPGRRARSVLVVAQIAVAVVLLVAAGLFGRTVSALLATDLGIDQGAAVSLRVRLTETTRFDAAAQGPFVREVLRRVRTVPGVAAAGIGSSLPPATAQLQFTVRVVTDAASEARTFDVASATPGYFEAIGARLVRGRWFEARDDDGPPIAVLTESAAAHLGALGDPVGRPLPYAMPGPSGTRIRPVVVGVIRDVRHHGLERPAHGGIYVPWTSLPMGLTYLVVRPASPTVAVAPAVLRVLRDLDPSLPLPDVRTLEQEVHRTILAREMRLALVGTFAIVAASLALAGLSGVLGRMVTERRREMAVRAVLGATPRRAVTLVARDGARLVGVGVVLGLALSALAGRALASLLYGVSPFDATTYAAVAIGVLTLAGVAVWIPARRASRVQPLELLRGE